MMLRRFYSIPERIDITFKNGLNIVCADITEKSTDKDTRNGVGKSTLLHLIDFCLLAELNERIMASEPFQKYEFILEMQAKDNTYYKIKRKISEPAKFWMAINSDDYTECSVEEYLKKFKEIIFGLPAEEENALTYRTLMNYVKRNENTGFSKIFEHFPMWPKYLSNAVNLYLLGMNYKLPLQKEELIKKKEVIGKIIFGLEHDLEVKKIPNKATLKSEKVIIDNSISNRTQLLQEFKVHAEYEDVEREANLLTKQIKELQNRMFLTSKRMGEYNDALANQIEINYAEIEELYKSMQVYLGDALKKKYEEIAVFHKQLIENRNKYLQEEIQSLEKYRESMRTTLHNLEDKRVDLMKILNTHGALSEYTLLIQRLDEDKERSYQLKKYISTYEEINGYKKEKEDVTRELQQNNADSEAMINQNEQLIKNIVLLFAEIYSSLVSVTGVLTIGIKEKYKVDEHFFELDIKGEREGSPGIKKTKIIAYDLAVLFSTLNSERKFPQFIMHDGVFSGVDSRPKKNALTFINSKSEGNSFQYILALNSDELPEEFNKDEFIIKKLTDTEDGSLMGFKF